MTKPSNIIVPKDEITVREIQWRGKMKKIIQKAALVTLLSMGNAQFSTALGQGTAFTYQGRLNDGSGPANGNYDLRFILYDNSVGGNQQGPILTNSATAVSNGLFTVTLDFGSLFPGAARWLDIGVRTNGGGTFTTLSPRQSVTPTPYAITAGNVVSGGIPTGIYGNAVTFSNAADSFSGTFSGNGGGLTNVNAGTLGGLGSGSFWQLGGNAVAGGQFVGSLNNQPLELRVNGQRGLRLEPTANTVNYSNIVNVIGGSPANSVTPGVYGATIAGGGGQNYYGFAASNSVASDFGVVGGGGQNQVQSNAVSSTVGGGFNNVIQTGARCATISGGNNNLVQSNSSYSTIGGGFFNYIYTNAIEAVINGGSGNQIQPGANGSAIGGGVNNYILTSAGGSTINGGANNVIQTNSIYSAIGGGTNNVIGGYANLSYIGGGYANSIVDFNNQASTIGGGEFNTNHASNVASYGYNTIAGGAYNLTDTSGASIGGGRNNSATNSFTTVSGGQYNSCSGYGATVPGGYGNTASGGESFAAGQLAQAANDGTFVWADESTFSYFTSTAPNQFLIRAAGGVGIGLNNPTAALHVASSSNYTFPQAQITQQNSSDSCRLRLNVSGHPSWEMDVSSDPTAPQLQFWNGTLQMYITYTGDAYAHSFNNTSDRNAKENFSDVSPKEVLDKVAALPITRWNFKEDKAVEHLGPMAQDFRAAFGLGTDDKHIATVDEEGVALAAIQGLNQKLEQKDAEIMDLKTRLEKLEQLVESKVASAH